MLRKFRLSACGLIVSIFAFAGAANAALITQTIDFSFDDFGPGALSSSPSLITDVAGSVSFTYDTATPVSIINQAVDSISFSTPSGFFLTSDVRFDLRVGGDKLFATNSYELDFYTNLLGVEFNLVGDFLFRIGAIGPVGADVGPGIPTSGMASQFLLIDRPGSEGFYQVSNTGTETSASVPVTTAVAEPAPLMVLGLGLAAFGLLRRRA